MVSKDEVEKFMLSYFPSCPLCGKKAGYEVSGIFKNYVQCKSCGAKWLSPNFNTCKELRNLTLWEPAYDGKGSSMTVLKKERSVDFWKDAKKVEKAIKGEVEEETEEKTKEEVEEETEGKTAPELEQKPPQKTAKTLSEMNDKELHSIIDVNLNVAEVWSSSSPTLEVVRVALSDPADRAMMSLLRALVHQNKAIIGQNELLYRLLSKKQSQKPKKH